MNVKKMMKAAAIAAILGTGFVPSAYADVSVVDIKCTPRTPWNGLVDVEYTVACDDPNADVYVNPVAYDGDRRLTMFPSAFTGDGVTNAVKAGKHFMVWDAMKDFGAFSSANFQLKMYAGKRLSRYVVIDLSSGPNSTHYPIRLSHVGPDLSDDSCRTNNLWLRLIPPGEFWMGSPADEIGRGDNEDLHHVTFTRPFYMGVFEVTMGQWDLVQGGYDWASEFSSSTNRLVRPVNGQCFGVSSNSKKYIRGNQYPNATTDYNPNSFFAKLRGRAHLGGLDLPTEARWEYACRAGTMTALYNGKNLAETTTSSALAEIGAYYGNRYNNMSYSDTSVSIGTTPVGSFLPNALGLYDMLGNVWEFCRDGAYDSSDKFNGVGTRDVIDPKAVVVGQYDNKYYFMVRGGWWMSPAKQCRAARRGDKVYLTDGSSSNPGNNQSVGFRVCAEAEF